ncbi:hypothetical protein CRG98_031916 [Punica granatum]|uniref:Uncharacterized protein n=1 Tax=Punica granatum TaxID=22663 RepID=A0A2I0IUM9_PUNGR|nr:hypothetical protein CRG98_031916 [Punica granatum]
MDDRSVKTECPKSRTTAAVERVSDLTVELQGRPVSARRGTERERRESEGRCSALSLSDIASTQLEQSHSIWSVDRSSDLLGERERERVRTGPVFPVPAVLSVPKQLEKKWEITFRSLNLSLLTNFSPVMFVDGQFTPCSFTWGPAFT